jgi:hypothetical protein
MPENYRRSSRLQAELEQDALAAAAQISGVSPAFFARSFDQHHLAAHQAQPADLGSREGLYGFNSCGMSTGYSSTDRRDSLGPHRFAHVVSGDMIDLNDPTDDFPDHRCALGMISSGASFTTMEVSPTKLMTVRPGPVARMLVALARLT